MLSSLILRKGIQNIPPINSPIIANNSDSYWKLFSAPEGGEHTFYVIFFAIILLI